MVNLDGKLTSDFPSPYTESLINSEEHDIIVDLLSFIISLLYIMLYYTVTWVLALLGTVGLQ